MMFMKFFVVLFDSLLIVRLFCIMKSGVRWDVLIKLCFVRLVSRGCLVWRLLKSLVVLGLMIFVLMLLLLKKYRRWEFVFLVFVLCCIMMFVCFILLS